MTHWNVVSPDILFSSHCLPCMQKTLRWHQRGRRSSLIQKTYKTMAKKNANISTKNTTQKPWACVKRTNDDKRMCLEVRCFFHVLYTKSMGSSNNLRQTSITNFKDLKRQIKLCNIYRVHSLHFHTLLNATNFF